MTQTCNPDRGRKQRHRAGVHKMTAIGPTPPAPEKIGFRTHRYKSAKEPLQEEPERNDEDAWSPLCQDPAQDTASQCSSPLPVGRPARSDRPIPIWVPAHGQIGTLFTTEFGHQPAALAILRPDDRTASWIYIGSRRIDQGTSRDLRRWPGASYYGLAISQGTWIPARRAGRHGAELSPPRPSLAGASCPRCRVRTRPACDFRLRYNRNVDAQGPLRG